MERGGSVEAAALLPEVCSEWHPSGLEGLLGGRRAAGPAFLAGRVGGLGEGGIGGLLGREDSDLGALAAPGNCS